ncbi:hypothetical protein, partial [Cellulomonas septica]|uniref:hypothetical protein n=1 Tax=Cellulomonas septica TaxID=285080 RepID=UPI001B351918
PPRGRDDVRGDEQRATRPPQDERVPAPPVPDDVVFGDLDRSVRARLRSLTKDNAERVGRHLVVVGQLLDTDPELAYEHAQAAVRRAGRIDVVREAAGLAAYRTGRFAEALRELRTVRRLNGSSEHLPIMADCERGLGRPERAIALANEPEAETLDADARIELAIVVSGARLDLGQSEAAVAVLSSPAVQQATGVLAVRVAQARATALEAAGRADEAATLLARYSAAELAEAAGDVDEEVVVFDLDDEDDTDDDGAGSDIDEASTGVAGAGRDGAGALDATDDVPAGDDGLDGDDEPAWEDEPDRDDVLAGDGEAEGDDELDEDDVLGGDDEPSGADDVDEARDALERVDASDGNAHLDEAGDADHVHPDADTDEPALAAGGAGGVDGGLDADVVDREVVDRDVVDREVADREGVARGEEDDA